MSGIFCTFAWLEQYYQLSEEEDMQMPMAAEE
jgi:hypothetical protein